MCTLVTLSFNIIYPTGPSLKLSDFPSKGYKSAKKEFTEADKKCFYLNSIHDAKRTVLLCDLQLTLAAVDDPVTGKLISTSGEGKHAEEMFISDLKKFISKETTSGSNLESVSIILLVNYSPCFKCSEELQYYLTKALKAKQVTLILRIGCLYKGCDETERKLAFWKNDLEMQGIKVYLEAINVVAELPMSINTDKRKAIDKEIQSRIENIESSYTGVKKLLVKVASSKNKYFVTENGPRMILGELTVSAFTSELLLHRTMPIPLPKKTADKDGQFVGEQMIIYAKSQIPHFWLLIWKRLLLVCVHVPTKKCRHSITEFLTDRVFEGKNNQLVLYLANIPQLGDTPRVEFVTWVKYLEENFVEVNLHPLHIPMSSWNSTIGSRFISLNKEFEDLKKELESWPSNSSPSPLQLPSPTSSNELLLSPISPIHSQESEQGHSEELSPASRENQPLTPTHEASGESNDVVDLTDD